MHEDKRSNFIKGAAILTGVSIIVKVISTFYRLPLFAILDAPGRGAFQVTFSVYALILAISTSGVPTALSRLISSANAKGNTALVRRYFSAALPAFAIIGIVAMLAMFFFAEQLATRLGSSLAAPGIMVLAPAVFFCCIVAVYRGYAQGHENMIPTAISQMVEVICKFAIGLGVAVLLVRMNYSSEIVSAGAISGVTIGLALCIPLMALYNRKLNRAHPPVSDNVDTPDRISILRKIFKVSIPISLSVSFVNAMSLMDNAIVLNRLQSALGYTEVEASAALGVYALGLTLFTIPPSVVVPVSVALIPAIAAALARKNDADAGTITQTSFKLVNLVSMPAAIGIMVLAAPLLIALYNYRLQLATTMLIILGAAAFFVCLQFITTSILQANGHERVAFITFPIGAAVRFVLVYILSGNPNFGIIASPIATLACFIVIAALNIMFIKIRIKQNIKLTTVFIKPLLCSLGMGLAAFLTYTGAQWLGYGLLGDGRAAVVIYLVVAVIISALVYAILVILTRVITKDDLSHVPRGDKLAKLLRVR